MQAERAAGSFFTAAGADLPYIQAGGTGTTPAQSDRTAERRKNHEKQQQDEKACEYSNGYVS